VIVAEELGEIVQQDQQDAQRSAVQPEPLGSIIKKKISEKILELKLDPPPHIDESKMRE
jgi:hypothetical protein